MKKTKKLLISLVVIFALMLLFMTKSEAKTPYDSVTFDGEYYLNSYPDLRNAFGSNYLVAYNHYLNYGIREGRSGSPYFDLEYYLEINEDVQKAFKGDRVLTYNHFINYGIKEGRSGSPYINPKYYLDNNKDLQKAFGKNYEAVYSHFINYGINEGRRGSKFFDVKYYLDNNKDLQNAFGKKNYISAFYHYLNNGMSEGRNPSQDVNIRCYLATYKDLQNAFGTKGYKAAAVHCYTYTMGKGEKRTTTHKIVSIKEVKPTCLKTGSKGGEKCQNCGEIIKKPTTVKTLAHKWTLEKVEWVSGKEGAQAKATMKCTVVNHKVETTDVNFGEGEQTKAPDCENEGVKTYSDITVKYEGKIYNYDKTLTTSIPKLGHKWSTEVGSMYGEWSGDYDKPTAVVTRPCIRNGCQEREVASSVEYKKSNEKDATCTEKGSVTYSAEAKFNGEDTTYNVTSPKFGSNNTYEIPALGHNWKTTIDEQDISWENVEETNDKDDAILKVKIKCSRDESHTTDEIKLTTNESENGKIDVEEVLANCGNNGLRTYKATVIYTDPEGTFDGEEGNTYTYSVIKHETVLKAVSGHAEYVWEETDDDNDGILNYKCSGCRDINKTIVRVTNKAGLKTVLESSDYQTIEIANDISDLDEVITIDKDVKILSASDEDIYKLVSSAENIFKVTGKSVELDKINLSGGSTGAILAENGAEIKASNTVSYETESYNKPFVVADKTNNVNVTVNEQEVAEFTNIQERVPFSGDISEGEDFVIRVGDSLKQKETNNKYYYLDSSKKDNFVKIYYIGDRAITLKVINYTVWYDKEKKEPKNLEPQNINYLTDFEGKLANYKVAKWQNMSNPSDTVNYGEVPVPERDISYIAEMKANYTDTEDMVYISSEDGVDALKEAVKSTSTYKTVVIENEITLNEKLVIEKEGIMITGSISGAPEIDGTLKGEIEVKANNVKFAKVKVVGSKTQAEESQNYVVTIDENIKSFRSSEVEYSAENIGKDWDGLLYFKGADPQTTLFFNKFTGDNAKALVEFGQEIKGENDELQEDNGTKLTGNTYISGENTENQIIIAKIADMTEEKEHLDINQNDVDLSKNKNGYALYIKEVGSNVNLNISSVYFLSGGKQDSETKYKIKIGTVGENLKVTFPSTRGGFTTEKWKFESNDNAKITVNQNEWNEEKYQNTPKTYDGDGNPKQ